MAGRKKKKLSNLKNRPYQIVILTTEELSQIIGDLKETSDPEKAQVIVLKSKKPRLSG